MPTRFPSAVEQITDPRGRRRAVLKTLIRICRALEQMHVTTEAKAVCRGVRAELARLCKRDPGSRAEGGG